MSKPKKRAKVAKKPMKKNVHKPNIGRGSNIESGPGPALESFIALRNSLVDEQKAAAKAVVEASQRLNKFDSFYNSFADGLRTFQSTYGKLPTSSASTTAAPSANKPKRKVVSAKARTKSRLVDFIYTVLKEKGPLSISQIPDALREYGRSIDHSVDRNRLVSVTIGDHRSMFVRCGKGVWRVRDGRKKES